MEFSHFSVLRDEAIEALDIKKDGLYVDCTAGGGGHSSEILKRLEGGSLIAIDRDPDAIGVLKERFRDSKNVEIVNDTFDNIDLILGSRRADGILADLGVSSFQLDTAERGFSFHKDAPLDMRMSKSGRTAADIVNTLSVEELTKIIRDYGEEKYALSIAKNIVSSRQNKKIETTFELVEIIKKSMPMKAMRDSHPARRTFQALRIEVNGELDKLSCSLDKMFDSLSVGGVLAIITFHSLEDRMVKQRFASFCQGCTCPKDFPVCVCGKTPAGELVFKHKKPSADEIKINQRSRSAMLRAVRKLKEREESNGLSDA